MGRVMMRLDFGRSYILFEPQERTEQCVGYNIQIDIITLVFELAHDTSLDRLHADISGEMIPGSQLQTR